MRISKLRMGSPQRGEVWTGSRASGSSARRRVRHARSQPALSDGEKPRCFARGKGCFEAVHTAATAVALSPANRIRGAKAATVGRVCRGRNDVLAHGNGVVRNAVQSRLRASIARQDHFWAPSAAAGRPKMQKVTNCPFGVNSRWEDGWHGDFLIISFKSIKRKLYFFRC
jgi:hypothetical protein